MSNVIYLPRAQFPRVISVSYEDRATCNVPVPDLEYEEAVFALLALRLPAAEERNRLVALAVKALKGERP
jgi:hypothetical protein